MKTSVLTNNHCGKALLPTAWLNIACGWEVENNYFLSLLPCGLCLCVFFFFLSLYLNFPYLNPLGFFFPIIFSSPHTPTLRGMGN